MVEQQALVIIHEASVSLPAKQMSRQLHHVVSATVFSGIGAELGCKLPGVSVPGLVIAGSTRAVTTFANNFIPEIFSDVAVVLITGKFVISCCSNHLRNMSVYMQAFQFIPMLRQGIEKPLLVEALGHVQVIRLASDCVQIRKCLAHAAVFCAENTLHVVVAERTGVPRSPARHLLDHV